MQARNYVNKYKTQKAGYSNYFKIQATEKWVEYQLDVYDMSNMLMSIKDFYVKVDLLESIAVAERKRDYMYRHPEETFNCTLELVRYMAMSTSQPRIVVEDFEWHGKQIKKGQVIFLMHAAGNRDPRVFADPEKLDHTRTNLDQSLSFSPGVHHCVGHLLAKLQLSQFFGELVKHFEGAELLDDELHFMPQSAFRGIHDLNVRFKPRVNH